MADAPPDIEGIAATVARLETALRTDDGTILPDTLLPDTGARALIEALPRLELGAEVSPLSVKETLGEGGMGVVRVAEQRSVGREVAVKTLRPERDQPQLVLHLLREAWLTGRLEHPNIVPIHDVGLDAEGRPVIVMKRVSGEAWSKHIAQGERDLRWHLEILGKVAQAVELAASRGVVHRDLKPDNVMIGAFGEVYVLDWGIAVSLHDDGQGRLPLARDVRGVAGTPGYMAPEMVREDGDELGPHTDVYLLGAILHELITKSRRHRGESLHAVLVSSMTSAPVIYPDYIPGELGAIANRATAKAPEDRFASAAELRAALDDFLAHDSARGLDESGRERLAAWQEHEAADPLQVQVYFQEARYAFLQSLREWPDNPSAQEGLQTCLRRKFEHDLARDDFEAAAVIAQELAETSPDQAARLAELRARIERRRAELDELRRLQAGRNLNVGQRTRAFLMLISAVGFGLVACLAPVVESRGWLSGYEYFYATSAAKLVIAALLVVWARDSLSKTQVNRQLTQSLFLLIVTELAIRPFAARLGHPVAHSLFVDFGVYALVNATLTITVDRRLWLTPVFYMLGAVIAYHRVEAVFYVLGAAHLTAYCFVALVWRPDKLFLSAEERRAMLAKAG